MNDQAPEPSTPVVKYRRDYRPPSHWIDRVWLRFELGHGDEYTRVHARMQVHARDEEANAPLRLHGESLRLLRVAIDGMTLAKNAYTVDGESLTIEGVPPRFELETEVLIRPQDNTALSGLYQSSGNFCTQCEAEGFRRITYFLDRPDNMARFTTTVVADREHYPILLSNGNRVESGGWEEGEELPGRHWVTWDDPFPKPSYLFALVAGDLRCHRGSFTTRSGREVALEIYVEPQNIDKCEHALRSLQRAMKWDEEKFDREYDLDIYMIVAVSDFNMGAMENKGLNVFNAKYVLARPDTATDDDYEAIEAVIAHEYFHNWTGNRVTCRDWFQLTLKEGLTVFRDQRFTADMTSEPVKRIADVKVLRLAQFPEDAGPMSHPIRPEQYIEMNNFYTATVYEKGAEVIRMYETLLGRDGFRRGMDLYFERHDGQAVTCDDFRAAMADANNTRLDQFERWYLQNGTPIVRARGDHEPRNNTYTLHLSQHPPGNVEAESFKPLHVPVVMGLIGPDGADMPLHLDGEDGGGATTRTLELREKEATYVFTGVDQPPVPSLLRRFSAPVRFEGEHGPEDLAFQLAHDSDPFNRWDAGQTLARDLLIALSEEKPDTMSLSPVFVNAFRSLLTDTGVDGSFKALALTLPDERVLGQSVEVVDPDALHRARRFARETLARELRDVLEQTYRENHDTGEYKVDKQSIDRRRLKNTALAYLTTLREPETTALAVRQFEAANNMTDAQFALACLVDIPGDERAAALAAFHGRWKDDPLVLDKWFALQATTTLETAVDEVLALRAHPDFTLENPNRARSLIGVFAMRNQVRFHTSGGRGYGLVADAVIELDRMNPQVAARIVAAFNQWKRFDADRQALMKGQLERILARHADGQLSRDVFEIVSRALSS